MKIVAEVIFDGGSHGFEEDYDVEKTVEFYVNYFKDQTMKSNGDIRSHVWYIEITTHNEDGSEKRDDNGERIMERIYENEDINF